VTVHITWSFSLLLFEGLFLVAKTEAFVMFGKNVFAALPTGYGKPVSQSFMVSHCQPYATK